VKYCDEYVCLSVPEDISRTTHAIFTKFLYMLPLSVAQSSSDMFTIGRIAYRREGFYSPLKMHYRPGKEYGSAQRGRSMRSTIALFILDVADLPAVAERYSVFMDTRTPHNLTCTHCCLIRTQRHRSRPVDVSQSREA